MMIYPVVALAFLTMIVWLHMYAVRISEVRKRGLEIESLTPFNRDLGVRFLTSGDNLRNLFEMPVLFYAAAAITLATETQDFALVAMASVYVALRYVHSFVHITYNRISHRFMVYVMSSIVLFVLWGRLAMLLLMSGETP